MAQAQFGMIGLGVMGENLALNVEEHGFPVAVWNLESDWVDRFVARASGKADHRREDARGASPRRWSGRGGS